MFAYKYFQNSIKHRIILRHEQEIFISGTQSILSSHWGHSKIFYMDSEDETMYTDKLSILQND